MEINKKNKIIIFSIVIFLICSFAIFLLIDNYKYSSKSIFDFPALEEQDPLSTDDYLYDFSYAWDVLEEYYPFFDVNKQLAGIDFLANKAVYQEYIVQATSDEDFYKRFNQVLSELNNYHVNLVPVDKGVDIYLDYRDSYRADYRSDFADLYEDRCVQNRYKITNELIENKLSENKENNVEIESINARCQDLIPNKIAFISIPQMISYDLQSITFQKDKELIEPYLQKLSTYAACVLDIRGNGGGDAGYWQEFLLPLIVNKKISNLEYTFIKYGPLFKKVKTYDGYEKLDDKKLQPFNFPENTLRYLEDFNHYTSHEKTILPSEYSIEFQGRIYLLVDEQVYSSAEQFASFMKETKTATLIGTTTGGDGIGTDPFQISLPKSGFVLRFPKQMGVTGRGSINDLDKTKPDIPVNDASTKYDFGENQINTNKDSCLEKVLELEGIK